MVVVEGCVDPLRGEEQGSLWVYPRSPPLPLLWASRRMCVGIWLNARLGRCRHLSFSSWLTKSLKCRRAVCSMSPWAAVSHRSSSAYARWKSSVAPHAVLDNQSVAVCTILCNTSVRRCGTIRDRITSTRCRNPGPCMWLVSAVLTLVVSSRFPRMRSLTLFASADFRRRKRLAVNVPPTCRRRMRNELQDGGLQLLGFSSFISTYA